MSRDFDKAQEMVVASMEYVKVLGFRIRRTEVQRDDWKQVAQSHADEMIKLRQHVDALKAERDAEREALGIQAAKEAGKALGMVEGEGLRAAAQRVVKERDALRTECDDLRRVFSLVHGSLGIQQGEHIGNAIDALKKERDELATRLRQSIGPRSHPVKVGEYLRRLTGFNTTPAGEIAQVIRVHVGTESNSYEYEVLRPNGQPGAWASKNCAPCDPPQEAFHDTPEGKLAAESVIRNDRKTEPDEIKVGDVAKVRSASGNLTAKCNVGQIGEVLKIDSRDGTVLLSGEAGWVDIQDVRKVTT